jgi:hypothetical protein
MGGVKVPSPDHRQDHIDEASFRVEIAGRRCPGHDPMNAVEILARTKLLRGLG